MHSLCYPPFKDRSFFFNLFGVIPSLTAVKNHAITLHNSAFADFLLTFAKICDTIRITENIQAFRNLIVV